MSTTNRTTVTLPVPVKEALDEKKPDGMTYWGFLKHELELDVDPNDL